MPASSLIQCVPAVDLVNWIQSLNDGEISKGTTPGTVDITVTAPEVTSTIDEHTSEVTHRSAKLPIGDFRGM